MDDDKKCKNLLCEQTCEYCKNKEDDFIIQKTNKFPYIIPQFYNVLLAESLFNNNVKSITIFINKKEIYIKAEDFKKDHTYLIHFQYPKCKITQLVIPPEMTCDYFTPLN